MLGGLASLKFSFLNFLVPRGTRRGFEAQHAINTKRWAQLPSDIYSIDLKTWDF